MDGMRFTSWVFLTVSLLFTPTPLLSREGQENIGTDLAEAIQKYQAEKEENQTPEPAHTAVHKAVPSTKMNPNISLIMDSVLAWYTHGSHIQQGGHSADLNGFTLQGLELAASASVDPYFRFDMKFELSHLHLEEAYLTTLSLPWNLQARAGFFNAAFGRHNPLHLHRWKFINPPLSHTRFMAEEHFSGLGAELSFLLPVPWYLMVLVEVLDTNPEAGLRSSTFGQADLTKSAKLDGPEDFVYIARLESFFELSINWSLQVGLNGGWGQSPYVPDNRATLYGSDLYLKWRPISEGRGYLAVALTLEYLLRDTQVPSDSVRDHGGYIQLDLQWSKQWMAGIRLENTDRLYGQPPDTAKLGDWQWRSCVVLTFMPTHFSKLRLQYDMGREFGLHRAYQALFIQVEVSTGVHGAHRL